MPPCQIKPPSVSFSILHQYWPWPDVSGEGVRKSGSSQKPPHYFLSSAFPPCFFARQRGLRWLLCSGLRDGLCVLRDFFISFFLGGLLFITVATSRKCCICGWRLRLQCDPQHPAKRHQGHGGDSGLSSGLCRLLLGTPQCPSLLPSSTDTALESPAVSVY